MTYKVSAADLSTIRLNEENMVAAVLQNIAIILRTRQGTSPLYREFGLPMAFLDRPMQAAKPMLVVEIKEAIERFEPRATVVEVTFSEDETTPGKLIPIVEVEIRK